MIKLGQQGKDKITGFVGVITGRAEYLYGCAQYVLVPPAHDGKCQDSQWFDEGRIEIIGPGVNAEDVMADRPGGPNRDAPRL